MSDTTLFLIAIVALPLAMMFMRRGAGMGGCCGGGSHHGDTDQKSQEPSEKSLLGPPGTSTSGGPGLAATKKGRHGCC